MGSFRSAFAILLVVATMHPKALAAAAFVDPLDAPAAVDRRAVAEPAIAVAWTGSRIVTVGLRGLVLYSDDAGRDWAQATVPVQSDLVAVSFIDAKNGWASGHDGVILSSHDGGTSWHRQFDGRRESSFADVYEQRLKAGDATAKPFLDVMKLNLQGGAMLPWLGIAFENAHDGYAVGPYGMIMATHDGGDHWEPWLDHIDNPDFLNLNAVSVIAGEVYIVGEKGRIYKLDRATGKFVATVTKNTGSFFGIAGNDKVIVAFGLLGHAYRSSDQGATWTESQTASHSSISGGAVLPNGLIGLTTQAGQVLEGDAAALNFMPHPLDRSAPLSGMTTVGEGQLATVGLAGVAVHHFP